MSVQSEYIKHLKESLAAIETVQPFPCAERIKQILDAQPKSVTLEDAFAQIKRFHEARN